jgi:hypothetical protein
MSQETCGKSAPTASGPFRTIATEAVPFVGETSRLVPRLFPPVY